MSKADVKLQDSPFWGQNKINSSVDSAASVHVGSGSGDSQRKNFRISPLNFNVNVKKSLVHGQRSAHLQSSLVSSSFGRLPCSLGVLDGYFVQRYPLLQGVLKAPRSCRGAFHVLLLHLSNKHVITSSVLSKDRCDICARSCLKVSENSDLSIWCIVWQQTYT